MTDTEDAADTTVQPFGQFEGPIPEVSCLMAAYSGDDARHLAAALESVGRQSGVDLELVLVLDGQVTSEIRTVVETYFSRADHPGKVIQTKENHGLARALNEGLTHCRSELVARFDADDVSEPLRLKFQLEFLRAHTDIDILGTSLVLVNEEGAPVRNKSYPKSHTAIRRLFFLRNPIAHPSVVYRRSKIAALGGYPLFRRSQDYALWGVCLVNGLRFANLPLRLVQMRIGSRLAQRRGRDYFRTESEVLNFLRDKGSISTFQYIIAFSLRYLSRQLNHILASRTNDT